MALNLWKIGGKPTSYNPLPTGFNQITIPQIGLDLTMTLKAKSPSRAKFNVWVSAENGNIRQVTLTPELQEYKFDLKTLIGNGAVFIYDYESKGDIIIEDIQLVQKPLPKLTINGIDGFLSGKWTLHANAKVIDDETLELNATGGNERSFIPITVIPNTTYTINMAHDGNFSIYDSTGFNAIQSYTTLQGVTFNSGNYSQIYIWLRNPVSATGKFTFKRPMLNLGSIPAPYEKKRGEKMVLPTPKGNLFDGRFDNGWFNTNFPTLDMSVPTTRTTKWIPCTGKKEYVLSGGNRNNWQFKNSSGQITYIADSQKVTSPSDSIEMRIYYSSDGTHNQIMLNEGNVAQPYTPYAVQVNKKPKRYVPKKNLIQTDVSAWEQGNTYPAPRTDRLRTKGQYPITQGKTLTVSCDFSKYDIGFVTFSDSVGTLAIDNGWKTAPFIFTPNSNEKYFRVVVRVKGTDGTVMSPSDISIAQPMVEEGTVSTPYEPYTQVLPRAKTGSAFNGTTDYLQLPSMTMDSIEIECLIDSAQNTGNVLLDLRTGFDGWFRIVSTDFKPLTSVVVDNSTYTTNTGVLPMGFRKKYKFNFPLITTTPRLFASVTPSSFAKATLYKVTCYLNGGVVATYDFENPQNIVGDKVISNAKNLIPSFEDKGWSLHPNFKVLGKDVGRLESTGISQDSTFRLKVTPGGSYLGSIVNASTGIRLRIGRGDNNSLLTSFHNDWNNKVYVMPNDVNEVIVSASNYATGTFDFVQPKLFELSGKEGTLFGKPTALRKVSKRTLYAKR